MQHLPALSFIAFTNKILYSSPKGEIMRNLFNITVGLVGIFFTASAMAGNVQCAKDDKGWQDKAAFEKDLVTKGYKVVRFEKTKGNCYELYGYNKEGKKTEIYFNPVTGEAVKTIVGK
jgi:hypothetical protein